MKGAVLTVAAVLILLTALSGYGTRAQENKPNAKLSPKVAALIYQLQADDPARRYQAATELLKMNPLPPDAIAGLFHYPLDPLVTKAAADLGQHALPAVMRAINGQENQPIPANAVSTLGAMAKRNPSFWPVLISLFKSDDPGVRLQASFQFGNLSDEQQKVAIPLLRKAMRDPDPRVRLTALRAVNMWTELPNGRGLAHMSGENEALPEITLLLKDVDPQTRAEAAHTLAFMSPPPTGAVPDLLAELKDPVREVRKSAAYALIFVDPHHPEIVPVLIQALSSSNDDERSSIVASFWKMGTDARDAAPTLERLLAIDPNVDVRVAAVGALQKIIPDKAAVPLAQALTQDKDARVRKEVVYSLRQLPDGDALPAIPALLKVTHDSDLDVRKGAVEDLEFMGKSAYPALIAALQNPDPDIRLAAVKALPHTAPMPDDMAKALITTAFDDKSRMVRNAAALALQQAHIPAGDTALANLDKQYAATPSSGKTKDLGRSYTNAQIIAPVPPDSENKYPMHLVTLFPINTDDQQQQDNPAILVSIHRGRERADRMVIWKRVGTDRYQVLQADDPDEVLQDLRYEPPIVIVPSGQPSGEEMRFLYIVLNEWRNYEERLYAIETSDTGDIELRPATIESAGGKTGHELKPDEKITNSDHGTAELGSKTYKVIKETHSFDDPRRAEVINWKFVPVSGSATPSR